MPDATQPATSTSAASTLSDWSFVPGSATFAALANAGLDDLIVPTPETTEVTGTSANDAIVYNVSSGGKETIDGGAGADALFVNGTLAPETFNINPINSRNRHRPRCPCRDGHRRRKHGARIRHELPPSRPPSGVEEIFVTLGNAGDHVVVNGDLRAPGRDLDHPPSTAAASATTRSTSRTFTSNEDVVFDGGANGDRVIFGFASTAASYQPIYDTSNNFIGATVSYTSADGPVTDTFYNVEHFQFTDGSFRPIQFFDHAPTVDAVSANGQEDTPSIAVTLTGSDVDQGDHVASFRLTDIPADGQLYLDAAMTTQAAGRARL